MGRPGWTAYMIIVGRLVASNSMFLLGLGLCMQSLHFCQMGCVHAIPSNFAAMVLHARWLPGQAGH